MVHTGVGWCGAHRSGVVWCTQEWGGVVHTGVGWCGAHRSGVVWCTQEWGGVVHTGVGWCGAHRSEVVWCTQERGNIVVHTGARYSVSAQIIGVMCTFSISINYKMAERYSCNNIFLVQEISDIELCYLVNYFNKKINDRNVPTFLAPVKDGVCG